MSLNGIMNKETNDVFYSEKSNAQCTETESIFELTQGNKPPKPVPTVQTCFLT